MTSINIFVIFLLTQQRLCFPICLVWMTQIQLMKSDLLIYSSLCKHLLQLSHSEAKIANSPIIMIISLSFHYHPCCSVILAHCLVETNQSSTHSTCSCLFLTEIPSLLSQIIFLNLVMQQNNLCEFFLASKTAALLTFSSNCTKKKRIYLFYGYT